MKKTFFLGVLFTVFTIVMNAQILYNENTSIVNLPSGITYQLGPGGNNSGKDWAYPYGTKLTINGGISRNFEIATKAKDNEGFMLRQFSQNTNNWTTWKNIILDDGNGNVGIGTTSPEVKLHINNGNNSYGAILANLSQTSFSLYTKSFTGAVNSESFRLGLKYNEDLNNGFISFYRGYDTGGGYLGFSTNGAERMKINASGNTSFTGRVGIGTTSSNYRLDVQSGGLSNSFYFGDVSTGNFDAGAFYSSYEGSASVLNFMENDDPFIFNFGQTAYDDLQLKFHKGMMGVGCVPDSPLTVNGEIHAKEVRIDLVGFADYVFKEDYKLKSLEEVEAYIFKEGHLEGFKSEKELVEEGLQLKEVTIKQQEKIEELTLYTISQEKKINKLEKEIEELKLLITAAINK